MATTPKNSTAAETVEEATVPHQAEPKVEKTKATVTAIKKDKEPEFYGEDDNNGGSSLVAKVKRLAQNKRVVAGAITTVVLTGAALVIRNRNSAEETDETPAEV